MDTSAPSAGALTNIILTDNVGTVTGEIDYGATTNDSTPTVSGRASGDAAYVNVYGDGTFLGRVAVDALTGTWSYETPAFSENPHSLTAWAVDAAGNQATSYSAELAFKVVTTPVTLALKSDTGTNPGQVPDLVSNVGAVKVGSLNCTTWQYSVDGGAHWIDGIFDSTGTGGTFTLLEGNYDRNRIQVQQFDALGNVQEGTVSLGGTVIDQTNPLAPQIGNAIPEYASINLLESLAAEPGNVEVYFKTSTFDADLYTHRYDATDSTKDTDNALNAKVHLMVNGVLINSPGNNFASYFVLSEAQAAGYYTMDIPMGSFNQGDNTVQARLIDLAGNTGDWSTPLTYYYDTVNPTATLTEASSNNSGNATVKSNEAGKAYLVNIDNVTVTQVGDIFTAANSDWNSIDIAANTETSLSLSNLAAGRYALYVTDTAGNLSTDAAHIYTVI